MLVVQCKPPNSAEQEIIQELKGMQGLLVVGFLATSSGRERELDLLLFTPVRSTVIEVKAPREEPHPRGELLPSLNSAWTVNGEPITFFGNKPPQEQARNGAQTFANFLREKEVKRTPFVQAAVAVVGEGLTMHEPLMLGQTAVALTSSIRAGLALMRKKKVDVAMVEGILEVMELGELMPNHEELKEEWGDATALWQTLPPTPTAKAVATVGRVVERYPTPIEEKPRYVQWVHRISDSLALFVVIFLFIYFVYTLGAFSWIGRDL